MEEGTVFMANSWPLHLTVVSIFCVTCELEKLLGDLGEVIKKSSSIELTLADKDMFGPKKDIPILHIEKNEKLQRLHDSIVKMLLEKYKASFKNLNYTGEGYKPHVTVKRENDLKTGDTVAVNSITLIDRYPNGNYKARKIIQNFPLGK